MSRTDFENHIAAELAAHTSDNFQTEHLLARATAQGKAIRRQRRRTLAATGAAAILTVAIGIAASVPMWGRNKPIPHQQAARSVAQVPAAPVVENRPARPDEIGSDPLRFHWRFDRIPKLPISKVIWSGTRLEGPASAGSEDVNIVLQNSDGIQVILSQVEPSEHFYGRAPGDPTDGRAYDKLTEETFPVGDYSAKLTRWGRNGQVREVRVTWTVLPGVYGYLSPTTDMPSDTLRGLVQAVRTDRVSRCAVPFRLRQTPPGAAVVSCRMTLSTGDQPAESALELSGGSSGGIVQVQQRKGNGNQPDPAHPTPTLGVPAGSRDDANREVNGKPALWTNRPGDPGTATDDGGQLLLFVNDEVTAEFYLSAGYAEDVALDMATGYEPALGNDPNTWPVNPVG